MPLISALLVTFALSAPPDRVLLCRPAIAGDPLLARAESLAEAARPLGSAFLDYGVACESLGEASRAASRAGLGHALFSRAQGVADGSDWLLVLASREEVEVARRRLLIAPGADAAGALQVALRDLERQVPRPPPRWTGTAGWVLLGASAMALTAGTVLAAQARDRSHRARTAATPGDYLAARAAWQSRRTGSLVSYSVGGAALAAGLVLELAF